MPRVRTLFLSDIHLGTRACQALGHRSTEFARAADDDGDATGKSKQPSQVRFRVHRKGCFLMAGTHRWRIQKSAPICELFQRRPRGEPGLRGALPAGCFAIQCAPGLPFGCGRPAGWD